MKTNGEIAEAHMLNLEDIKTDENAKKELEKASA